MLLVMFVVNGSLLGSIHIDHVRPDAMLLLTIVSALVAGPERIGQVVAVIAESHSFDFAIQIYEVMVRGVGAEGRAHGGEGQTHMIHFFLIAR